MKAEQLKVLLNLAKDDYLDLYFADESGFSLTPSISYHWQQKNENVKIVPRHSKRINVFGIMSKNNDLFQCHHMGKITSDFVIQAINEFSKIITKKTVICLDNARIHHSKEFRTQISKWKKVDIEIFYLPKYSPHLNSIEILWRKIKYEWLRAKDYTSWEHLEKALENIFSRSGDIYNIALK